MDAILIFTIDIIKIYKINLNYLKYIQKNLVRERPEDSTDVPKHVLVEGL